MSTEAKTTERGPMLHHLKVWPPFYESVENGSKTFEVRRADRDFRVDDLLILSEWEPRLERHTGRQCRRHVSYVLQGGQFGVEPGFVVLGFGLSPYHRQDFLPEDWRRDRAR